MGLIQGSINQLWSLAGVASNLYQGTPGYQKQQEQKKIKTKGEDLLKRKMDYYKSMEGKPLSESIVGAENIGLNAESIELAQEAARKGVIPQNVAAEQVRQAKLGSDIARGIEQKKIMVKPYSIEQFLQDKAQQEAQARLNIEQERIQRHREAMKYYKE